MLELLLEIGHPFLNTYELFNEISLLLQLRINDIFGLSKVILNLLLAVLQLQDFEALEEVLEDRVEGHLEAVVVFEG